MFFFNDTATTEIYTLSLHDALPIFDLEKDCVTFGLERTEIMFLMWIVPVVEVVEQGDSLEESFGSFGPECGDRKSTRLNSSHRCISYAVFCLKKKKKKREKTEFCVY